MKYTCTVWSCPRCRWLNIAAKTVAPVTQHMNRHKTTHAPVNKIYNHQKSFTEQKECNIHTQIKNEYVWCLDRLCGLVVRVSGYRYRGPGFDPRRYQIFWVVVGLERVHSASWGQLRSYLNEKSSGSRSRKRRLTAVGTPLSTKVGTNFADRRRLLCQYSSCAD